MEAGQGGARMGRDLWAAVHSAQAQGDGDIQASRFTGNLRGRCNRGSVGEARSPSGGKSFFSHVLLLFSVSFILEVETLMA